MKTQILRTAFLALSVSILSSQLGSLHAQGPTIDFPKASPAASVKEHVGFTTIDVEYGRPGMKGRKIFGGLVPYGEIWRTGANEATRITFSTEVLFGGEVVPAGTYALFTIPGEKEWTVILNKVSGQWGSYQYNEASDQARVKVSARAGADALETFSIGFQDLRDESAKLVIGWDKTRVAVDIEVDVVSQLVPQIEAVMAGSGDQKPYFAAAMFYYEHDVDLKKAVSWMDEALKAQPDAMWMIYRKGLILAKAGNKGAAREAAMKAHGLAEKAGGELGAEYQRLCEALIDGLE